MKNIKGLLLFGILTLLGIGSSFGANPFWYNTIIRESNQTALPGLESYNYYNTMYTYDYENGYQYYLNGGFCSYSNYLNFTFDCNGLLNSGNYLNSNLDNFVAFWNSNMLYNRRTEKFINHQSSFDFDLSGNIRYSILDCMSGSSTECIQNAYLFFSNSGEFGSLVSSEKASYIHLIGSNYNKNPGILGENKMNHYYFITSKRISSDYGSFYDIPNSYIRKKFYNGLNHTISSISYNSGGWLLFTSTDPLQWSYNESDNIYRLISTSYSGYLVLGVNNYSNGITQNGTIVLSMSGGNILYNYYNSYSPYLNVLSNLTPQDKGYFGNSSLFGSFINDSGTYFEVSGTPNNGNLLIRSYLNGLDAGGFYTDYNFELVSDSNTPVIIPPIGNGGNGSQSIGNVNSNSLYYNCLGPTYSTPDGLPPAYCYDSSGELNPQRFQNCFNVIEDVSTGGFISHTFCYIDGFQQEVVLTPEGSGYSVVPGVNTTNVLDRLNDGYSTGYFENFFNSTGYFFKCPFPYSDSLTVWPKLISMMNGFDINLPINCSFAGFNQGKQVFTFEHSGHLIQGGPLLNFEGDNRKLLYIFFDIVIILGLLFFFGKILKFFS